MRSIFRFGALSRLLAHPFSSERRVVDNAVEASFRYRYATVVQDNMTDVTNELGLYDDPRKRSKRSTENNVKVQVLEMQTIQESRTIQSTIPCSKGINRLKGEVYNLRDKSKKKSKNE